MQVHDILGFLVAQMVKNLPVIQEMHVRSLSRENPLKEEMATHWYSCLENSINRGAWRATAHGVAKIWDMTGQLAN